MAVPPGAAGDGERAVLRVVERPLDRDLAAGQERRPVALERLARDDANAVALVGADLGAVLRVEHVVGERQDVARAISLTRVGRCVRRRVLDHGDRVAVGLLMALGLALPLAPSPDAEGDCESHRAEDCERRETLHGVPPWIGQEGPTRRAGARSSW